MNKTISILFCQEFREVIRSRLVFFILFIYLAFSFVFIFIATKESDILGFTGMGRVIFSLMHGLVFTLPLLSLSASSQLITQYRENGTIEFFLSLPVSRQTWFLSMTLVRLCILVIPFIVILVGMSIFGLFFLGQNIKWIDLIKFLLVGVSLIWCFLSAGLFISEKVRNQTKSLVLMLFIWMSGIALMDFILIAMILKFHLNAKIVFFLACLNPVQAARLALLSVLDADLSILGSMGFFIATQIGRQFMLFLGIVWPLLLGSILWFWGSSNFSKKDVL